jgi:hypothetical protein
MGDVLPDGGSSPYCRGDAICDDCSLGDVCDVDLSVGLGLSGDTFSLGDERFSSPCSLDILKEKVLLPSRAATRG